MRHICATCRSPVAKNYDHVSATCPKDCPGTFGHDPTPRHHCPLAFRDLRHDQVIDTWSRGR